MRTSKPITVTLGELQERAEARRAYTSVSDVLRAGLRALDREELALEAVIRQRVQEALDNPDAPLTHEQIFGELGAHHAKRMKATQRGAWAHIQHARPRRLAQSIPIHRGTERPGDRG